MASPSKKVASGIGISCIWQLHSPWGMLPGLGQELPGGVLFGQSWGKVWITCEVVHPAAELPPPPPTGWVKAAGGVVANRATMSAPVENPGGLGIQRSSFPVAFFFGQQKIRPAVLRVLRAVATRAE